MSLSASSVSATVHSMTVLSVAIVVLFGGIIGWTQSRYFSWLHRRYVDPMPYANKELANEPSQTRIFQVSESSKVVMTACVEALAKLKRTRVKRYDSAGLFIKARVGVSFRSLGEIVSIQLRELGARSVELQVRSKPWFWGTSIDYGKGFENVEIIRAELAGRIPILLVSANNCLKSDAEKPRTLG